MKTKIKRKFGKEIDTFEDLDGVKVYLKNGGWLMIRSSGTEKKVRVYVESPKESDAVFLLQDGVDIASSCGS